MSDNKRVIVVGTTSDYIDLINRSYPGRCLFITDPAERARAREACPQPASELLHDLNDADGLSEALRKHFETAGIVPSGIVAYDDESMLLASRLAKITGLPYPSAESIMACRNKYMTKKIWRDNMILCPETELISQLSDATSFLEKVKRPVILKPLTGSGSELVFRCENKYECLNAFIMARRRLADHANTRMYAPVKIDGEVFDSKQLFEVEEHIQGREYSCDFMTDGDRVIIIRVAKKVMAGKQPFGTTLAYVIPALLPARLRYDAFLLQLRNAAHALGINRAVCMLDFIVKNDNAYLLEIAPRPGGDCLPPLIQRSSNLDVLGLALDFAENRPVAVPDKEHWKKMVGMRIFADQEGTIANIDTTRLSRDKRVVEIFLKRSAGHQVIMPPDDYDSRILGYVIFEPFSNDYEEECLELSALVNIQMERPKWAMAMDF